MTLQEKYGDHHDDHCNIHVDGGSCNCAEFGFCAHGYHESVDGGGIGCPDCRARFPQYARDYERERRAHSQLMDIAAGYGD